MKIFFDIVGCRLNQSEVERLANIFRALGHEIVGDPGVADIAVINTCAVTVKAAADSRKKLRRAARVGAKKVIATGCWATLYPEEARALPGVSEVVSNAEKDSLVSKVLNIPDEVVARLTLVRESLPGVRRRTRAFIKVQEGCNNHCTYCLTRLARGGSHSRALDDIQRDVQAALTGGAKEIVLTGVQLGAWGQDFPQSRWLDDLIAGVLAMPGIQRLRLSSIEPWDFDPVFLSLWQDERLCRQLHIPLQSGDDPILKAMGRPITSAEYLDLIGMIREEIPEMAITTDVITGFPGETEESFQTSEAFLKKVSFAGGHVFTYSPRPGTAAFNMKEHVPAQVAKRRNAILREVLNETSRAYRDQFIGRSLWVLWESSTLHQDGSWELSGLTDNYVRVLASAAHDHWNEILEVSMEAHHSSRPALIGSLIAK